ncbi:MAG: addiction module toxin RelE [Deltaproteobacteria bacterium CG2_30_66_27]|nr:MAG: addiction module toxin RelE [Deltaproteobacteria bacterium CG2_30_66_27]PJB32062.1 MAG: addiction module toxin RelE [Deltaproteobacteria bacterium CG_4_9_14_3_um_filter_65_9]
MRVIARKTLRDFWEKRPAAEQPLKVWYAEALHSVWVHPKDIKTRYSAVSFLTGNRVVFNIKGNKYRLITHVRYDLGHVYIRFIGTHPEYDKVNAATV